MIVLKKGDITQESVDAIVNAANSGLRGGGGVDGAIHRAAGPSVMQECRTLGGCPTGSAVMTGAGQLSAKKILHAVGPVWGGGSKKEPQLLESCYETCFRLAKESGLKSLAFPAISTGVYGYPKAPAARIALTCGLRHEKEFDAIHYVCFSEEDLEIYQQIWLRLKT